MVNNTVRRHNAGGASPDGDRANHGGDLFGDLLDLVGVLALDHHAHQWLGTRWPQEHTPRSRQRVLSRVDCFGYTSVVDYSVRTRSAYVDESLRELLHSCAQLG